MEMTSEAQDKRDRWMRRHEACEGRTNNGVGGQNHRRDPSWLSSIQANSADQWPSDFLDILSRKRLRPTSFFLRPSPTSLLGLQTSL